MAKTTKTGVLTTPTAKATTVLEDSSPVLPLPNTPQGVMAVGPRVSLHFITSGYNKANSYEYYDVVNVDGTSYIAIQNVPANTPVSNADYWVKWNDPNAQFALLQDTVESFDKRITEAQKVKKTLCVIGDSYTQMGDWVSRFAEMHGFTEIKNYGVSGSAYFPASSNNFTTQLNSLILDYKNKHDEIGLILVVGGTNDFSASTSTNQFAQNVNNFAQVYATNLSDVLMLNICAFCPPTYLSKNVLNQIQVANYYLTQQGIATAAHSWALLATFPSSMGSDNIHPNSNGFNIILSFLNSLFDGKISFYNQLSLTDEIGGASVKNCYAVPNGIIVSYVNTVEPGFKKICSFPFPISLISPNRQISAFNNEHTVPIPCYTDGVSVYATIPSDATSITIECYIEYGV